MIRKDRYPASTSLYAVAAIQGIAGVIRWVVYSSLFVWGDWVITFSFVIFLVLGVAARQHPIPATIIAAVIYGTYLFLQASVGIRFLRAGLIFKVPVVVFLVLALIFAFTAKKPDVI